MSKILEAKAVVTEELLPKELIKVIQVPEIEFTKLKEFNAQIMFNINSLDLENMVATPDNVKEIKAKRTDVRKSLQALEDSRKFTEKTIMGPYKAFEKEYNKLVKLPLTVADKLLKSKIDTVEDDLRKEKTNKFKEYVETLKVQYDMPFINFEDLNLNIQLSTTESSLTDEIHAFFVKVENDLRVIDTNVNKTRVLAMYMKDLDLANAIVNVENAIQVEQALEAKQQAVEVVEPAAVEAAPVEIAPTVVEAREELVKAQFIVTGTKAQLKELANYMESRGIKYE